MGIDLIAQSEREVEAWVLGLNEVVPYRLERQRFTAQEFLLRRAMLRLEVADGQGSHVMLDCHGESAGVDQDWDAASGCTSNTSKATSGRAPSAISGRSGSESVRSRVRNMMHTNWGVPSIGR